MSANHLYHTWFRQIRQLLPDERITRVRNFIRLISGIYQSRSVHLSHMASKIPDQAKELSIVQKSHHQVKLPQESGQQGFGDRVAGSGQSIRLGRDLLTQKHVLTRLTCWPIGRLAKKNPGCQLPTFPRGKRP